MLVFVPVLLRIGQAVLNDNAQVDKGDNARLSSFVGAIAIADLVKTTLGPKGRHTESRGTTGRC